MDRSREVRAPRKARTLRRDQERLLTLYACPAEHWKRIEIITEHRSERLGTAAVRTLVAYACRERRFTLLEPPKGDDVARARWDALRQSNVAVFDLSVPWRRR
jgi:hypothetical protein